MTVDWSAYRKMNNQLNNQIKDAYMRITSEKDEHGEAITVLRDVFSGVKFVTDSGHCLGVCMRDDGYEISVFDERTNATPDLKKPVWFQVDPRTRTISRCEGLIENAKSDPLLGLHCLKPRKITQPFQAFHISDHEKSLLASACGYFVVDRAPDESRNELFAYTVDHGQAFILTDNMNEVLRECAAASVRHAKSIFTIRVNKDPSEHNDATK